MKYDKYLAERVDRILIEKNALYYQKEMFGGTFFMIEDKMTLGVIKENLYAKVGMKFCKEALTKPGVKVMDFSGKPSKSAVYVTPDAVDFDADLEYWVQKCLDNLYAK